MIHTFEIKDFNEPIDLGNDTIDNSNGNLTICLKDVSFWIGYYNISKGERIKWRNTTDMNTRETDFVVEPGLYSVDEIKKKISTPLNWLYIGIHKNNGKVEMEIPEGKQLKLSADIADILSLDHGWVGPGSFEAKIDFQPFKAIYLHCHQISSTGNFFNGKPTTLLNIIPLTKNCFGTNTNIQYTAEVKKPLEKTIINSLSFSILDSKGNNINNHGMPIIFTVEII